MLICLALLSWCVRAQGDESSPEEVKNLFQELEKNNAAIMQEIEKIKSSLTPKELAAFNRAVEDTRQGLTSTTVTIPNTTTNLILVYRMEHHPLVEEWLLSGNEPDITKQPVDAIVNPANQHMQHGGGVALVISKAAGPQLQAHHSAHPAVKPGTAIWSDSFDLKENGINYILHAVGPDMNNPQQRAEGERLLRDTWYNTLALAADIPSIKTIAFPSISTGIFGFPKDRAAHIAINTVVDFVQKQAPDRFEEIRLVLWDDTKPYYINALVDAGLLPEENRLAIPTESAKPSYWQQFKNLFMNIF